MKQATFKVEELAAQESFQAYCLGTDEKSIAEWEAWQVAQPEQQAVFEEAKAMVLHLSLRPNAQEITSEWKRLEQQIAPPPRRRFLNPTLLAVAASVALLLALGIWFWMQPTWQTTQTAFGETTTMQLEDGTKVALNANSSIRYKSNLATASKRELWLKGEAYFEVEHNEKPFVVHTDRGDVRVLGTIFNIEQRSKYLQMTLLEGRVQVALPNFRPFEMKAGTSILFDAKNQVTEQALDLDATLAWKSGKMLLRNVSIETIVTQLKTEFGILLKVTDASLLERKVSAPLLNNDPKLLLEAVAELYDLQIEQLDSKTYQLK